MVPVPLPKKVTVPTVPNPVPVPQHCQQGTGTRMVPLRWPATQAVFVALVYARVEDIFEAAVLVAGFQVHTTLGSRRLQKQEYNVNLGQDYYEHEGVA